MITHNVLEMVMKDLAKRPETKTIFLICISVLLICHARQSLSQCIGICEYPGDCIYSDVYEYGCLTLGRQGFCEPFVDNLGNISYAAYYHSFDCDGIPCLHPCICDISQCTYPSKGQCIALHGDSEAYSSRRVACSGVPEPNPPYCDISGESACPCQGGGGGGAGGGGGGSSSGGPLFSGEGPNPESHSPAPAFNFRYDYRHKADSGMGMGWTHNYMYRLEEDRDSGAVVAYTQTGGFVWGYRPNGDGSYEAYSYDATVLEKYTDSYVATGPDGTSYVYDHDGRLTHIVDANGNSLALYYNAQGLLERVSDDFGRSLQFSYTSTDRLESVTGPRDNRYTFLYQDTDTGNGNLVAVQYPDTTRKRFEYNDQYDESNLTRIIDNNNNTTARYSYDEQGRLIRSAGAEDSNAVEIDHTPSTVIFSDDFQEGFGTGWAEVSGSVEVVNDPDQENYAEQVARLHPGIMRYEAPAAVDVLRVSFDLWVGTQSSDDFRLKIYDAAGVDDSYGAWIRFAESGDIQAEHIHDENIYFLDMPGNLAPGQWHRIEIEADAREYKTYFKIWVDCEYIDGFPFKRNTFALDSVAVDGSAGFTDIYIDNFQVEKKTVDGSRVIKTYANGSRKTVTEAKDNDFGGVTWLYETDGTSGQGCTGCSSEIKQYDFDDRWNLRRKIDGNGVVTEMTYDDRGNMLSKTEAAGSALERATTWTWHPEFNKPLSETIESVDTGGQNKQISYSYDENGNLLSETAAGYSGGGLFSYTTSYQYNSRGQLIRVDGPRTDVQDVTVYDNNARYGYVTSITYPNGTVFYTDYDADHNVGSVVDLNGVATRYTYDYANRVRTVTIDTATTEYVYDGVGNIDHVVMPGGNMIDYSYDAAGRLVRITDNSGNYIAYEYDSMGNRTGEQYRDSADMLRKHLSFTYDSFNRLTKVTNPDNSFTLFDYDNNTNRTGMVDPEGISTQYEYDGLNRLVRVVQAAGTADEAITDYEYDAHDNLVSVSDAENKVTAYGYDDFGRLVETLSPDTGLTTYSYDEAGNLVEKTDARNITTRYEYDALNRLVKVYFPDDVDILYTYDENDVSNGKGRLTTMQDQSGNTRYTYDERGNIIKERKTVDTRIYETVYGYDLNSNLATLTYPGGMHVSYTRDTSGNITAVSADNRTIAIGLSYEPFGRLTQYSLANGIETDVVVDERYRVKQITSSGVLDRTYTHDTAGNITSMQKNDTTGFPAVSTSTDSYGYVEGTDTIEQVDRDGTPVSYTHDEAGNITSRGSMSFTYSQNGRMVQALAAGSIVGEYTYDCKNRRVKKVVNGEALTYHYDLLGNLIAESGGQGTLVRQYIYAGDMRLCMVDGGTPPGPAEDIIIDNNADTVEYLGEWPESVSVEGYYGSDYQYHIADGNPPGGIVIDNTDSDFSTLGAWTESTAVSGYYETDYLYHEANGAPPGGMVIDNTDTGFTTMGTWTHSTAISGYYGPDYQYHEANGDPPGGIIVDNEDSATEHTGVWPVSGSAGGYYGSNYRYQAAGSGADSFTWLPGIPQDNHYHVYARWTAHANRASNAAYPLNHAKGADTVIVNQKADGGTWNYLGTYRFTAQEQCSIVLTDNANGYVIADAVKMVPVDAPGNSAVWTPDIPEEKEYKVYARWTAHPNRAKDAKYTVNYDGGSETVMVNQQENGGTWVLLGSYQFAQGSSGSIVLTDEADGYVIADAVMLVPGDAPANSAVWTPEIAEEGWYRVYARWSAHANRATDAKYTINHDGGSETVMVNQQENGGTWVLLGTYYFNEGTAGTVMLTDEANGYVIADAVKLVSPDAPRNSVIWTPDIEQDGQYEVYVRWTAHPNRATDAKYTITHERGSETIVVNQQQNGGEWNYLGTFTFTAAADGSIILTDEANGYVIADAVKLHHFEQQGQTTGEKTYYYYHNDHLGTPQVMTGDNGTIVWKAAYNPFGMAEVDAASTVINNFRFPGQYYDEETGLHYNWHRYYDPWTGRYLRGDPIGLWGSVKVNLRFLHKKYQHIEHLKLHLIKTNKQKKQLLKKNLYRYALNNPLINIDYRGLNAITNPQSKDDLMFYWGYWKTHSRDCYNKGHCDLMLNGCNLYCQDSYQDNYIALSFCISFCIGDYSFCLIGAQ